MINLCFSQARLTTLRHAATLLGTLLVSTTPAALASEDIHHYPVKPGDNLYRIAEQLLNRPSDWQAVAKLNAIKNPDFLQPGSTVKIPLRLMRGVAQSAQVLYLRGEVKVIAGPDKGKALSAGQTLREGNVIAASANGWLGLGLQDGSQIYVSPNSQFTLQRLRDVPQVGARQTEVKLKQGRADFAVEKQPAGSRFEVTTPLAVTGVRGTRFGVALNAQGTRTLTDLLSGAVVFKAGAVKTGAHTELAAGHGIVLDQGRQPALKALPDPPQLTQALSRIESLPFVLPLQLSDSKGADTTSTFLAQLETISQPAQIIWLANEAKPTLSADIADGNYLLRVRAISSDGLAGKELLTPLHIKTTPAAPLIQTPAQGAHLPSGQVTLLCAGDDDAKGYLFQISGQIDFAGNTQEKIIEGSRCRWDSQLDQPQAYFWRVATLENITNAQRGPFSAPTVFNVVKAPSAPEASESYTDQLRVQWAGEPGSSYQLQIAHERDFAAPILDLQLSEPHTALDIPLGCRDYFIRIKSTNQYGMSSAFSKVRRLNTPAVLCSSNGLGLRDSQGQIIRLAD
ncbi:FecR domain-containing protein [Chitinibacter sp. FCG-7]|uniref:FecR domain-containing protein n=1 Tax=Chitinibacter mangrovi TaxID=3153927 RepID=A0AAU7FC10_9NEIS